MYQSIQTITLVVFQIISIANGVPIGNGKWKNPCGRAVAPIQPPPPLPPQIDVMSDIILRLNEGIQMTSQLKHKIATTRVVSQSKIRFLEDVHLTGLPVLPVTEDVITSAIQNKTKAHLTTYAYLSNGAIFLEQVKYDETNFRNGDFLDDILQTESKLYTIMCHVQMIIDQSDASVVIYPSRDIMSVAIRTLKGRTDRTNRDYIIVKDILQIFQSVLVLNKAIKASAS